MIRSLFKPTFFASLALAASCGGVVPEDYTAETDALVSEPIVAAVSRVATGYAHGCALENGGLACWGNHRWGQLGFGAGSVLPPGCIDPHDPFQGIYCRNPIGVKGLSRGVKQVAAAEYTTCALLATGTVACWGKGKYGELGLGTTLPPGCFNDPNTGILRCDEPVAVPGLSNVASITAGLNHFCAQLGSGVVKCWGDNQAAQLGIGFTTPASCSGSTIPGYPAKCTSPVTVRNLTNAIQIDSFAYHTCAITSPLGAVVCWGYNGTTGALGVGRNFPTACWGDLGGFPELCTEPVGVSGLGGVSSVSAGGSHTCAITPTGQVRCWGSHIMGELGIGHTVPPQCEDVYGRGRADRCLTPVTVPGLSNTKAIDANHFKTYAIDATGKVRGFGTHEMGTLGVGPSIPPGCEDQDGITICRSPTAIPGLGSNVVHVAGHSFLGCAALDTGAFDCWGTNGYGMLGIGFSTPTGCEDWDADGVADWCPVPAPVYGY